MQYLEERKAAHFRKVLFGTSMEATTAINFALCAGNSMIDAIIADSTAPNFFKIIEKVYRWKVKYPWSLVRSFLVIYIRLFERLTYNERSFYGRFQALRRAILFIHGKKDGLIDYNSVNELYEMVRCEKEIMLSDTAVHIGMMKIEPDKY